MMQDPFAMSEEELVNLLTGFGVEVGLSDIILSLTEFINFRMIVFKCRMPQPWITMKGCR